MLLISPYVNGDQAHYRKFYSLVEDSASIIEIFKISQFNLGSVEPVSTLMLWGGAYLGIDKDIYISVLNVILCLLLVKFLLKFDTHPALVFLFLANFYLIVVMTGAERLKFAYIFLLAASLAGGKFKYLLYSASFLSHFQMGILFASGLSGWFSEKVKRTFSKGKIDIRFVLLLVAISVFFFMTVFVFGEHISGKIESYSDHNFSIFDLLQISIIGIGALFFGRDKFKHTITLLSLVPALILLGGSRVNMIIYSLVVFLLVTERRQNNIFIYSLAIYFSIKSVPFIESIYEYGDGFYGLLNNK